MRLIRRLVTTELLIALALPLAFARLSFPYYREQDSAKTLSAPKNRVDINSATIDQLLKVPGMTRTWAARIVHFRPYRAKNELLDRGVVSNEVYNRIKDYIIAHHSNQ